MGLKFPHSPALPCPVRWCPAVNRGKEQAAEYRCPGEPYPISRAVHLGRLARFYPGCRQCVSRDATGTLSPRKVKRLLETRPRGQPRPLFDDEGASGVYLNDLGPRTARDMAAALGIYLRRRQPEQAEPPAVVIAGDGRAFAPELVAAVGEGLRWSGANVFDIGAATAACTAFAVDNLHSSGGILVGNPGGQAHTVGLSFWQQGARPISSGGSLEAVQGIFEARVDRPTRTYGSLRRFGAEAPYLATLADYYHALRPLRLVLDTTCRPLVGYIEKLTGPVACRIFPCRTTSDRLGEQVRKREAHFGVRVDGDGRACRLLDEQGRQVPFEQLFLLIARHLLTEQPDALFVLEDGTSPSLAEAIHRLGGRVVCGGSRCAEMDRVMRRQGGIFGGGPSGRLWYTLAGDAPLPDALVTITLLLHLLSQSDRPLSKVLDAEVRLP